MNFEKFNFYKFQEQLKKPEEFQNELKNTLEANGIEATLEILKSSGAPVNMYASVKADKKFKKIIEQLKHSIGEEELSIIEEFQTSVGEINEILKAFHEEKNIFFSKEDKSIAVPSFLISLEIALSQLDENSKNIQEQSIELLENTYEALISYSTIILNYFIYEKYPFTNEKRNISPNVIDKSSGHLVYAHVWEIIYQAIEYWKYSDARIEKIGEEYEIELTDEEFDLNRLVMNYRMKNSKFANEIDEVLNEDNVKTDGKKLTHIQRYLKGTEKYAKNELPYVIGFDDLSHEIAGVSLYKWVHAHLILKKEAIEFIERRKKLQNFSLFKLCIVRSKREWESFFKKNGYSESETEVVINFFTYNNQSSDLNDCPFIEFNNNLVLVPSITKFTSIPIALSSNFTDRKVDLTYKGTAFEERIKRGLSGSGIKCARLYKKIKGSEYECDVAFVIDKTIFFVECKAHNQPFTPRQHANHLYKLYEDTNQLKRITDFYKNNLELVFNQLGIEWENEVYNFESIVLTTSKVGIYSPINNTYIIDEGAFISFLCRVPPGAVRIVGNKSIQINSERFSEYKGEISAKKMITFLKNTAPVQISKELFNKGSEKIGKLKWSGLHMSNRSIFFSDNLDSQKIITWSGAQHLRCYIIATASS